MAARLTKEDRIERLVAKTRQRVNAVPKSSRSLRHHPSSKLSVLVKEGGYERASSKYLDELTARLRKEDVGVTPELTDPANVPDTRIYFFDLSRLNLRIRPTRELFKVEKDLSRFIWLNRDVLGYLKKHHLQVISLESPIAAGSQIDLLAVDTKTNELVGIELKAEAADDGIVGQAARYMRALKAQAEAQGRAGARLLIVTGQPDEDLAELVQMHAEKFGVQTDWVQYRVSFEFVE